MGAMATAAKVRRMKTELNDVQVQLIALRQRPDQFYKVTRLQAREHQLQEALEQIQAIA